jgi:hypothetical protein
LENIVIDGKIAIKRFLTEIQFKVPDGIIVRFELLTSVVSGLHSVLSYLLTYLLTELSPS